MFSHGLEYPGDIYTRRRYVVILLPFFSIHMILTISFSYTLKFLYRVTQPFYSFP